MKGIGALLGVAALCAMLAGCTAAVRAPVVPPLALIYTDINAPIDTDASNTPMTGKKGCASTVNILGMVAWGDASVKAAADEGGLTHVDHVDYEFINVLFFFSRFKTIVYGQ